MNDSSKTRCCCGHADEKCAGSDPGYRRALWIVIQLNLYFGLMEIIGTAIWGAVKAVPPEADLMGGLGVAGLLVNVTAALALRGFREGGDANARAIWLFSRNDALANIAVIIAAALVAWLKTSWPDLVVAAIIALLFLHSAWKIIRDALAELKNLQAQL